MRTSELITLLKDCGLDVTVEGDELHYVSHKDIPQDILDILNQHKEEIMAAFLPETLDGHKVVKVRWKLPHGVIFEDETGTIWRYLEAYKTAWPVILSNEVQ